MLLTITYRGERATDLGYLLHKNPRRPQQFKLSFGRAYVFYPRADDEVCTAALLIDLNPIDLARGKVGSTDGGLFDYVNDRPYVASSFMSTALSQVFSTAMNGRCDARPALAAAALDLEARIAMLPCRGDSRLVHRLFEPLGYAVEVKGFPLDEAFPQWGDGEYVNLTLRGSVRLCDLLNHLYVLIPVFDRQKHYWMSDDEVEKLLRHGEGWLPGHPEMRLITHRYFHKKKSLASRAIERLLDADEIKDAVEPAEGEIPAETAPAETAPAKERRASLNDQRLAAVAAAVLSSGAASVVDLGCGEGRLLAQLIKERQIERLLGMDVSIYALERSRDRLHLDRAPERLRDKVALIQGSLTYRDRRIEGFDAACLTEVIEHMDPDRLLAL
ncbi:MAG: 3' terminal RNA ribose 2'-O-methyltransferase Hen1, partial [Clostridiales bacterium]|nr:3' terminal RNA ribose 2'-O-methyltransferase Hen1 [Clostridiales bacterium]